MVKKILNPKKIFKAFLLQEKYSMSSLNKAPLQCPNRRDQDWINPSHAMFLSTQNLKPLLKIGNVLRFERLLMTIFNTNCHLTGVGAVGEELEKDFDLIHGSGQTCSDRSLWPR